MTDSNYSNNYSNNRNPFNDEQLDEKFEWSKKRKLERKQGLSDAERKQRDVERRIQSQLELEKLRSFRHQREQESLIREEEREKVQREKEREQAGNLEERMDLFHLHQAKLRAAIRIRESRPHAVDLLVMQINLVESPELFAGCELMVDEAYAVLPHLSQAELKELIEETRFFAEHDKEIPRHLIYWTSMTILMEHEMQKQAQNNRSNSSKPSSCLFDDFIPQAVQEDIHQMLYSKNCEQLETVDATIDAKLNSGEPIDIEYWDSLKRAMILYSARAKIRKIHADILKERIQQLSGSSHSSTFQILVTQKLDRDQRGVDLAVVVGAEIEENLAPLNHDPLSHQSQPPHRNPHSDDNEDDVDNEVDTLITPDEHFINENSDGRMSPQPQLDISTSLSPNLDIVDADEFFISLLQQRLNVYHNGISGFLPRPPLHHGENDDVDPDAPKGLVNRTGARKVDVNSMQKAAEKDLAMLTSALGVATASKMPTPQPLNQPVIPISRYRNLTHQPTLHRIGFDNSEAANRMFHIESSRHADEDGEDYDLDGEVINYKNRQGGEFALDNISSYHLDDIFRPRKPRYFNRVHTGYEWNRYNQMHFNENDPPPKVVQGYKFNVFYPDLIDKSRAPTFKLFINPNAVQNETAILKFTSGPPYEDIAFIIVNMPWEYGHRRGFRCSFERGILQLWFRFRRETYRR